MNIRTWFGRRPGFGVGVVCGIALVFASRFVLNNTTIADWLVAPLILPDSPGTADVIVVMGAGVVGECVGNHNSVRRVLLAARSWRENRAHVVVFTGGTPDATCPVAAAMARLAREVGIPESSMHLETTSQSTRENGERTAPILRHLGMRRILLVTDALHMRRAEGTFRQLGFDVKRASVPVFIEYADNVAMLQAAGREAIALAYYRVRGWLGDRPADSAVAGVAPWGMPACVSKAGS